MLIPELQVGEICTDGIQEAVTVLEHCKVTKPCCGFRFPFFAPGGQYGEQWWQLDGSIALDGYKWFDQGFAENGVRNFFLVQKEDGRIPLWGADRLPDGLAAQVDFASSLPEILRTAFTVAERSKDRSFLTEVYSFLTRYLDWWQTNRLNEETGLLTALFEETFVPYLGRAGEYAPVDTNVEVALGYERTARLAEQLGYTQDAEILLQKKTALFKAIENYLWCEDEGVFCPYSITEKKNVKLKTAQGFYALSDLDMPEIRKMRLLQTLQTSSEFGWENRPLTSVALTDQHFTITHGDYQGNASWSGMVWSLINYNVVCSLERAGEKELAAELAYKTVKIFNHQYTEFADPFDGSGHGVQEYAWTASHYVLLLIEHILGIRYNAWDNVVLIRPNICACLEGKEISVNKLALPCGGTIDVCVRREKGNYEVQYTLHGEAEKVKVICASKV